MPAGVTASNIRNNRRKQKELAEASETKANHDFNSPQGSQDYLGGRRREGKF